MAVCIAMPTVYAQTEALPTGSRVVSSSSRFVPTREATERQLEPVDIEISHSRSLRLHAPASFIVENVSRGVIGRLELLPEDSVAGDKDPVRLFLADQKREAFELSPGKYRLRLAFRALGETQLHPYPHETPFEVESGEVATLRLTRDQYDVIKKWLIVKNRPDDSSPSGRKNLFETAPTVVPELPSDAPRR
jgi:hypothetical protein